ncbi:rifin [Plasmodium reichenowi]|uniref:Rifin n=1 Tax=Plasmodium reichenowi TaxID=5854 RepID=A0A060RRF3_PLARE|nr:rifin [Plasmodium reichenowi]
MKVHYINILFFVLPLNILVNVQSTYNIPKRTPNSQLTKSHRSLCECELFAPANYDNNPQMKKVMENFNRQTSQRFHEYDDRMKITRQKCKEKCDKEVQKIILKDKLEKQMAQQFATLHTDIKSDAIPTCVCEKSLADKMEKGCLRCGYGLGTVAPTVGLIGSVAVNVWKTGALKAAIKAALDAAAPKIAAAAEAARIPAGKNAVIESLKKLYVDYFWPEMSNYINKMSHYNEVANLTNVIYPQKVSVCNTATDSNIEAMCDALDMGFGILKEDGSYSALAREAIPKKLNEIVVEGDKAAKVAEVATEAAEKLAIETTEKGAIDAASYNLYTAIGYSVLAIIIIVLIMVIIYLILRYRRKKKMKKKLQYIKLLEE